jgi:prepilin-type N-terminal cleavage/methylation domain-containing protein
MKLITYNLRLNTNQGQSLIEIIIGLAIGGILIGAATSAITLTLRQSLDIRTTQIADALVQEYLDNLQALAESDWHKIYCPPDGICPGLAKGPSSQFYLVPFGNSFAILSGATSTLVEGKPFSWYFSIENVNR